MARSRRSGRRQKRRKVDWVVNIDTYGTLVSVPNNGLVALPLTYPQFAEERALVSGGSIGGESFPEAVSPQTVRAVQGHYSVLPGTWAAGSSFAYIARIVKKPMDVQTNDAIADALYSLDDPTYANERFVWQKYHLERFDLGGAGEVTRVSASFRQHLEPDEALYFMFNNISGITQTVVLRCFLRTLMEVPE